jgi:hypothetical protein
MTLADFMMGEPNLSNKRIVTKTEKPRPMTVNPDLLLVTKTYQYTEQIPKAEHEEP